ncbi:MAG: hypothetical protein QOJ26_1173 [Thermoplasmata archaeon]|jgi:hypothetical protein|nr:hypothetical protein [Thermoplasmata archaeon]MEA3166301.1 hypothetical protein [Thermoplasmata archaeon]
MNHNPKPETANATFVDGDLTIRLTFPAEDAALWRSATAAAILGHLGLGERPDLPAAAPAAPDEADYG